MDELLLQKQTTLYGAPLKKIKRAILTPVNAIYAAFPPLENETRGWYRTGYITNDIVIVKCNIGTSAGDAAYYLPDDLERLILVGWCGGYGKDLKPGDYLSALAGFRRGHDPIYATHVPNIGYSGNIYQVESLAEEDGLIEGIRPEINIAAIDMETHSVLAWAVQKSRQAGAIYLVTDHLFNYPFYLPGSFDHAGATKQLVRYAMEEILR